MHPLLHRAGCIVPCITVHQISQSCRPCRNARPISVQFDEIRGLIEKLVGERDSDWFAGNFWLKFKFPAGKSQIVSSRSSLNFENRFLGHKISTKSLEISLFTPFGRTPNCRAFYPSSRPLFSRFLLNHEITLTVLSLPDAPKAGIMASAEAGESLTLLISISNFTPASCAAFLRPWT